MGLVKTMREVEKCKNMKWCDTIKIPATSEYIKQHTVTYNTLGL